MIARIVPPVMCIPALEDDDYAKALYFTQSWSLHSSPEADAVPSYTPYCSAYFHSCHFLYPRMITSLALSLALAMSASRWSFKSFSEQVMTLIRL